MAMKKLTKKGYGQIELNQVAWRRDGRIEAQCRLDDDQFPADATAIGEVAENGMLFAIDNVTRTLKKATLELAKTEMIGINYSTEHLYSEREQGYKDFFLTGGENFLRGDAVVGLDLGVDVQVTNPAGNELIVLAAEVQN